MEPWTKTRILTLWEQGVDASPPARRGETSSSGIWKDLVFPIGTDDPGSVFESWFDVIPAAAGSTPGRSATRAAKNKPAASGTGGKK
jgi:hypothetical protein